MDFYQKHRCKADCQQTLGYTPAMRARILAANRANGRRYLSGKLYNLPFESAARTAAAVSANLAAMLFFFYISR